MLRLAFVVVSFVAIVGCNEPNPASCANAENVGKPGCPDAPPPSGCMGPADCTPNTPVCATTNSPPACVQCTDDAKGLCTGTTPLCKSNSCAACALDSECGTDGLCLPTGACVAAANIIHATSNGSIMPDCGTKTKPCNLTAALATVDTTQNVIKLDEPAPTIYSVNGGFTVAKDVTIDARNALIKRGNDGTILTINNGQTATIYGGTIEGATNGDGISCGTNTTLTADGTTIDTIDRSAITAGSGCKLTLTHVNINNTGLKTLSSAIVVVGASITLSRSSFFSNKGGGINVTNGTFVIVGNSFSSNGDVLSPVGGMSITTTASDPMNRIEFNTIASNVTMSTKVAGVDCTVGTGLITTAIARNNIIWDNNSNVVPQVGGTCKHAYSDIGMLTVGGANDGGTNLSMDPMFQTAIYDLHLKSGSPTIMKADPNAKLDGVAAKDIDGDPRIAPADLGVDQRPR